MNDIGHQILLDTRRSELFCCSCHDYQYDGSFDNILLVRIWPLSYPVNLISALCISIDQCNACQECRAHSGMHRFDTRVLFWLLNS